MPSPRRPPCLQLGYGVFPDPNARDHQRWITDTSQNLSAEPGYGAPPPPRDFHILPYRASADARNNGPGQKDFSCTNNVVGLTIGWIGGYGENFGWTASCSAKERLSSSKAGLWF